MRSETMAKIALNAAKSPRFAIFNRNSWSPRTIVVTGLPSHSRLTWLCICHTLFLGTAGWIRIPLGVEIGLGPGHIVLDGDAAPQRKRAQQPPLFGPCLLWPSGAHFSNCSALVVNYFYSYCFYSYSYCYCDFVRTFYIRYWLLKFKLYYSTHFYFYNNV